MNNIITAIKKFWSYVKVYKVRFIMANILSILTTFQNIILPYLVGMATTRIAKNILNKEAVDLDYIKYIVIAYFLIGFISALLKYLSELLMANTAQNILNDLRIDIDRKINKLPIKFFDNNKSGNIISRITNDVATIGLAFQDSLLVLIRCFVTIIITVITMFYLNWQLSMIAVLMIPSTFFITRLVVRKSQKYFDETQKKVGDLNAFIQETVSGFNIVKIFGIEKEKVNEFKEINEEVSRNAFMSGTLSGILMPLTRLSAYIVYIIIATLGSSYVLAGALLLGQLQAFIVYIWNLDGPMEEVIMRIPLIQGAFSGMNRVFEILDEEEIEEPDTIETFKGEVKGHVEFKNVFFSYDKRKQLIENLNINVKPGQMVAIVGPTGAGKTTIINLILKFYKIDKGEILIDGVNINNIEDTTLRKVYGMVLQDPWLYNDTILENIRLGKLDATDYEIVDICKEFKIDHVIKTMPNSYHTVLNEESANISIGQKQLMTIARAVLKDPKILILDEATSSVDTRLETSIQKAIEKATKGRTSFVIAHRLSTIRNADLILVVKEGKIIETGTHESLIEEDTYYRELHNTQFAE